MQLIKYDLILIVSTDYYRIIGLTSDLYYYIILSNFETCLWLKNMNFTGHIIYFDYQERDCTLDNESTTSNEQSLFSSKSKYHTLYYRSTISFRSDHDLYKLSNSTQLISINSSLSSNQSNETNIRYNMCNHKIHRNYEYFTYSYLLSQLPKSYRLHSIGLFNSLNLIINILHSNIIDCKTFRINDRKLKPINSDITDVNIYSIRKVSTTSIKETIELIGKYSSIHDNYQSCQKDRHKDSSRMSIGSSSKIYYITSLFDEPFLMLRKAAPSNEKQVQPEIDLTKLRGQVFDFHELEGFCLDLAEKVCLILNITCKFRIVKDGGFGSKNATTGTWDGMK